MFHHRNTNELVFRVAGHEDYQAVIDIHDHIYGGLDYVPKCYHDIINTKNTIMYLAEIKGRVVGMITMSPCLSGRAMLGRALRVHPEYQGQGINRRMMQYSKQHYTQLYPAVAHMIHVVSDTEFQRKRLEIDQDFSLLDRQNGFVLQHEVLSLRKIADKCSLQRDMEIYPLQKKDIKNDNLLHLFPGKVFTSETTWLVHETSEAGIKEALEYNKAMITKNHEGTATAISFMTNIATKIGHTSNLYYYGDDIECFKTHVISQLKEALEQADTGIFAMWIAFPESLEISEASEFLFQEMKFVQGPYHNGNLLTLAENLKKAKL